MRKTLIALAVAGTASVAFATSNNIDTGRFGAPVGVVTGETESGPVHSLIGQVSGVYPAPQHYGEATFVSADPVIVGSAGTGSSLASDDGSASVSRTWYMPDGSVVQEGPISSSSMSSDDLLASSSWSGMGDEYIVAEVVEPDYIIFFN